MISVIVKPASFSAVARKVARLPAPTMATVGFLVIVVIVLPVTVFGSTAQHTLYCCHGEIGTNEVSRNEVGSHEVSASPRSIFPH
jgi:hypothetical protein